MGVPEPSESEQQGQENQPIKRCTKNQFLLPALIAGLGLIIDGRVTAQTFTTLHSFTTISSPSHTNSDGANPWAGLTLSGNNLYGTAVYGGNSGNGTVFAVNTDGTRFTNLHSFTPLSGPPPSTNTDGAWPYAGLILSGNTLYGTAQIGGSSDSGSVFAVNIDGTGFTNLYSFTATAAGSSINGDGANPVAGLTLSGNILYGTTDYGGTYGNGTVFAINTDGTGFTNLHSFAGGEGANPRGGLILSGSTLYGTASGGAISGNGTVFAIKTNGTGFTKLHMFAGSDGGAPSGGLVLSGETLYGAAAFGGSSGNGTVFAINTDGTGYTNLHSFAGGEGANPLGGLILSESSLYGTTEYGGNYGNGTVFAINTNGTSFTNLYSFTTFIGCEVCNLDGSNPNAGLILSGNTLYGTATRRGSFGNGTVFSLSFRPQLTIVSDGANAILTWPTNVAGFDYTGFTLQSTTNLVSPGTWTAVSPGPVVVNGQNTVTNPISGTRQFFRLIQ